MGLKLLHHKSWHVYNAVNIERVRKDEEEAARQNEAEEKRTMIADSEARMSTLRKNAKKRLKDQQDEAEAALDRQLKGKGREVEEPESRATILRAPTPQQANSSIELDGHINFWADFERGARSGKPATDMPTATNAEHEAEARKEKQKFDEQITMYIREPPKPWYSDPDLASSSDRKRTTDERLEAVYKDGEHKRMHDPLAMMNGYLDRRERVLDAQERVRKNPWMETPKMLKEPERIEPKLLRPHKRQRSMSPKNEEFAPMRPPPPAQPKRVDAQVEAKSRESAERARAAVLIAKSRRGGSSVASTPRSEAGFQDRYNPEALKNLAHHRWDDRPSRRETDWRDRDGQYNQRGGGAGRDRDRDRRSSHQD